MEIKNDFSLQKLNTFGINAIAKHFIEIHTYEDLKELIHFHELRKFKNNSCVGTIAITKVRDTSNYGSLLIDKTNKR